MNEPGAPEPQRYVAGIDPYTQRPYEAPAVTLPAHITGAGRLTMVARALDRANLEPLSLTWSSSPAATGGEVQVHMRGMGDVQRALRALVPDAQHIVKVLDDRVVSWSGQSHPYGALRVYGGR